ncbi:MAG: hypothetical protein UY78_C0001G0028, partial [Parcubacteria group bacterium GW2011_GWA1_53_13]
IEWRGDTTNPSERRKIQEGQISLDFQGRGVAKEMFTLFLGEMRARGVKVFRVLVGEKLQRAIAWYEKQGFRLAKSMSVHGKERSRIYLYTIS